MELVICMLDFSHLVLSNGTCTIILRACDVFSTVVCEFYLGFFISSCIRLKLISLWELSNEGYTSCVEKFELCAVKQQNDRSSDVDNNVNTS
jgi:hypothetical protein